MYVNEFHYALNCLYFITRNLSQYIQIYVYIKHVTICMYIYIYIYGSLSIYMHTYIYGHVTCPGARNRIDWINIGHEIHQE